ncbi:MAG: acyltransferase domain-containing protein, partial [Proteobacteria bacterium]|nr:acyltransferase domain-containing protein [Pseudomonadota bacterium]
QSDGVFCRRVEVDYASHSAQVDPILASLSASLADVMGQPVSVPMVSTVTGARVEGPELNASYWCQNLREPVRLDRALEALQAEGHGVFVEVSAHPVLAMPLTEACVETAGVVVGSLRRDEGALATLHRTLGVLHTQGHPVDWGVVHGERSAAIAALPTYAFQRQRYWLEAKPSADVASAGLSSAAYPLLGAATPLADSDGFLFTGRLSVSEHRWLADHTVFDTVLVPGTGLLELVLAAGRTVGCTTVSDLMLAAPLVLPERGAVRVQLHVEAPDGQGHRTVALYSRAEDAPEDGPWTAHATGMLSSPEDEASPSADPRLQAWPPAGGEPLDLTDLYPRLAEQGLGYGPAFQGLTEAFRVGSAVYGRVVLPASVSETSGEYSIHPALLDAALHTLAAVGLASVDTPAGEVMLPFAWSDVTLHARGAAELRVCLEVSEATATGE